MVKAFVNYLTFQYDENNNTTTTNNLETASKTSAHGLARGHLTTGLAATWRRLQEKWDVFQKNQEHVEQATQLAKELKKHLLEVDKEAETDGNDKSGFESGMLLGMAVGLSLGLPSVVLVRGVAAPAMAHNMVYGMSGVAAGGVATLYMARHQTLEESKVVRSYMSQNSTKHSQDTSSTTICEHSLLFRQDNNVLREHHPWNPPHYEDSRGKLWWPSPASMDQEILSEYQKILTQCQNQSRCSQQQLQ